MKISNTIHIDAAPHIVWGVTIDVERWPEWTPSVTSVKRLDSKPFALGSRARIEQPMQAEAEWTVTEYSDGRSFSWESRRPGMYIVGAHEVWPEGTGTKSVLRVDMRGLFVLLLWPVLRVVVAKSLKDENRGLKARCEQRGLAQTRR